MILLLFAGSLYKGLVAEVKPTENSINFVESNVVTA